MRRRHKIFLSIFGFIFALILTGYFAVIYIQSTYIKERILPRVLAEVKKNTPIQLKISDIDVSFWRGVVISGIEAQYSDAGLQSTISISVIELKYSLLTLLSKNFVLDSLAIKDLQIKASGSLPEKAKTPPPAESPLKALAKTFEQIPILVQIRHLSVSPIEIDLALTSNGKPLNAKLSQIEFFADAIVDKTGIALNTDLKIPTGTQTLEMSPLSLSLAAHLQVPLSAKVDSGSPTGWKFSLPKIILEGALTNLKLNPKINSLDLSFKVESKVESDGEGVDTETHATLLPGLKTGFENLIPIQLLEEGAELTADLSLNPKSGIQIRKLQFENTQKSLRADVSGSLSPLADRVDLHGNLELRGSGAESRGSSLAGEISLPWKFTRANANRFLLSAQFLSQNFSVVTPDIGLEKMNADVPVTFDIELDAGKLPRFSYVITRNPFEVVDYSTIRPYVSNHRSNFTFDRLRFKTLKVGPLAARFFVHQNFLTADDYELSLFDGRAAGRAFIDIFPGNRRLGFLGRLTGLNPKMITSGKSQATDQRISSRIAMVYSFDRSMAEGRLDVTEIGAPQVIDLIAILDPNFQDAKMNLARSLLKVAHPEYLGLKMSQGFLALSLDLGGLVSISNLNLPGIPLSPVLMRSKQNVLKLIGESK